MKIYVSFLFLKNGKFLTFTIVHFPNFPDIHLISAALK